jgi:transposase
MKQQRQYEKDFKIQTVKYILENQKPVTQVARELEISDNTLYGWVKQYKADAGQAFVGRGHLKADDQAIRDFQKRIRDLEEENAILKKAMHIFVKDRR